MTPARSVFDWMPLVQIRRRIGVAAALYAGLHFLIYVADQKWDLIVVALEIVKRFYLTIGFAALLMLAALAITSTNGWQKRLQRNWKRLHWLIYPAAVLAILHFFIQSKNNVGEATVAAGLFAWLMLWRWMPTKLRTRYLGLALLAVGATLAAVVFEVAWYGLVNDIDPIRVLEANIDPDLAPRPALKVLMAGLRSSLLVALRRLTPPQTPLDEALYPGLYRPPEGGLDGWYVKRREWLGLARSRRCLPGMARAQDGGGDLRRRQPEERARRDRRRLDQGHRQACAQDLLCRELGARQADRTGRAGRPLHLGRSRLDGLCREEGPDQGRHAREPPRQQDRADRAQGLQDHESTIKPGFDLAKALAGGKLAMANVDAVPAGKYGKAALEKLGAWNGVKDNVAQAENVRAALLLVARGEAPLGIVYAPTRRPSPT